MGKGSNTQKSNSTSTSTSAPDAQAYQLYSNLLQQAQGVANTPYQGYGGELVAPFNAQQNMGVSNINSTFPTYGQAGQQAQASSQPLTAQQIQQYQSPYTQNVVDATQNQFNNQNARQVQQSRGQAIQQGALGGNRQGVAEANLANSQQLAQAPVIAGLYNSGYQNAVNTAQGQQQIGLAGAQGMAGIGNSQIGAANAQIGAGTLQQQTQQAQDAAQYQQFQNQKAYPFQTLQWLAGLGTGVGSQMGGTSSGQGTQNITGPTPSPLGQGIGAASGVAGMLGSSGAFGAAGWMAPMMAMLARGGRVTGYADGGGVLGTLPEGDDTLLNQQDQLTSGVRGAQMFPNGTPELQMPEGMERTETPNGVFHHDPSQVGSGDIHQAVASGRENDVLNLGPYSKEQVFELVKKGEEPLAIVERGLNGVEVRAAVGTKSTLPKQMAYFEQTKSPGNRVEVEPLMKALAKRQQGAMPGRAGGGGVAMPYSGATSSWVPSSDITRGAGVGGVKPYQMPSMQMMSMPQQDLGKSLAGMGGLAGSVSEAARLHGPLTNDPGDTSQTTAEQGGLSASDENPSLYWRGGPVGVAAPVQGFADGGAPVFEGGVESSPYDAYRAWEGPTMKKAYSGDMGALNALEAARSNPPPDSRLKADTLANWDQFTPQFRGKLNAGMNGFRADGGGIAVPVPSFADGGSPVPDDFDSRFPQAGDINSGSPFMSDPKGNAAMLRYNALQDPIQASGVAANVPLPRPRPPEAGGGDDLPPEIMLGMSRPPRPAPTSRMPGIAMNYDGAPPSGSGVAASPPASEEEKPVAPPVTTAPTPPPAKGNGVDWGANSKLWPALMTAGFGMMASRSPFPGVAIGEGGLQGATTYQNLQKEELARGMTQQRVDLEAKRLTQSADQFEKKHAQEQAKMDLPYSGKLTTHEQRQLALDAAKLEESRRQHDLAIRKPEVIYDEKGRATVLFPKPGPDGVEYWRYDPSTGQLDKSPIGKGLPGANPNPNAPPPGPGAQVPQGGATIQPAAFKPGEGLFLANQQLVEQSKKTGGYDYSDNAPYVEKGMDVPEPQELSGRGSNAIKIDAEKYLQTGALPKVTMGNSPVARQQAAYAHAVQNYGTALAASRGMSPQEVAEAWRTAPGMLRFILGADGRATVSLGTAVRHLDTLAEYAKAWNAGDERTINRISATLSREFGGTAATNLETVAHIVGPEIVKAIGIAGAGTGQDREGMTAQFTTARSYPQVMGAVVAAQKLMGGQLEGKERQALNAGVSKERFKSLIGDRPYEILSASEKGQNPLLKPSLDVFVAGAKKANPGMSEEQLREIYKKKYGP